MPASRDARIAVDDQADVGRGAADVDADQVVDAGAASDVGRTHGSRGRPRQRRLDRHALDVAGARNAAAGFHEQQRRSNALLDEPLVEPLHVARDDRHHVHIEDGRHAALVLAEHGQHVARDGDRNLGEQLAHDLGRAPLVGGVGVAVQEDDGDGIEAIGGDALRRRPHRCLVERGDLGAVRPDPAGDLVNVAGEHRAFRLHPRKQVGPPRHVLPADLQHVLETGRGQQAGAGALALEDQIGRHGRAVQHAGNVLGRAPGRGQDLLDAVAEAARRIVGRRWRLRVPQPARGRIEQGDVREGAAGIHTDDGAGSRRLCCGAGQSSASW